MCKSVEYILVLTIYIIKYTFNVNYFGAMDSFFRYGVILICIVHSIPLLKTNLNIINKLQLQVLWPIMDHFNDLNNVQYQYYIKFYFQVLEKQKYYQYTYFIV